MWKFRGKEVLVCNDDNKPGCGGGGGCGNS